MDGVSCLAQLPEFTAYSNETCQSVGSESVPFVPTSSEMVEAVLSRFKWEPPIYVLPIDLEPWSPFVLTACQDHGSTPEVGTFLRTCGSTILLLWFHLRTKVLKVWFMEHVHSFFIPVFSLSALCKLASHLNTWSNFMDQVDLIAMCMRVLTTCL